MIEIGGSWLVVIMKITPNKVPFVYSQTKWDYIFIRAFYLDKEFQKLYRF